MCCHVSVNYRQIRVIAIFLCVLISSMVTGQTYDPPIGIPAPEFGINETVENVYGSVDYYTHYVDNTHPSATDDSNPNGSPEKPRKSVPTTLTAGSVVEIHGGPYSASSWTMNGTLAEPVFVRGVSDTTMPVITKSTVRFNGQYFIVEYIDFYERSLIRFSSSCQYGTLRNSSVHNPVGSTGASNPTVSATGDHIVLYNNEIHDNNKDEYSDVHGIQASSGGEQIWVLDNHIYNNGGDGIQACHGCKTSPPRYLYIGRNNFHGDKENGIDLKYAVDVIISQNKLHGYLVEAQTGMVSPVVVGSDGAPTRVWLLFNEIYDCTRGIRIEEVEDIWMIGNVIYDIHDGTGIIPEKKGTNTYVVGNTLYNMNRGISESWKGDFGFHIFNNIFSNISSTAIKMSTIVAGKSEIQNNLFWQTTTHGENAINADPLFTDAANADFSIQAGSPAIDAGRARGVLFTYESMYGIDIQKDYIGEIRPQGDNWDIGAYEFQTGTYPTQYALNINTTGSGSIFPAGGTYVNGDVITLTAIQGTNYQFDSWGGDLIGVSNPAGITMDSDKNVMAIFSLRQQFNLTVNTTGSGNVTRVPSNTIYATGTTVTLIAKPNPGFQFDGWSGDLSSSMSPALLLIDTDKSVSAGFSALSETPVELPVTAVTASTFENPNVPINSIDNDLSTRWSSEGEQWIRYDLGSDYTIAYLASAWLNGSSRVSYFDIDVSSDTTAWTQVFTGQTSGITADLEKVEFSDLSGRYLRISCHGNSSNDWNSITELDIYGYGGTSVSDGAAQTGIPESYALGVFPNPFNPGTTIYYHLPESGHIEILIYDLIGRKVKELYNGHQKAGTYQQNWTAVDANGYPLVSGVYFVRIQAGQFRRTVKVMYLR